MTHTFWITKTCQSVELVGAQKEYSYNIPAQNENEESFPAISTNYVLAPSDGCTQTFDYEMADGSAKPSELVIDSTTGLFTLTNKASQEVNYQITILVNNIGGSTEDDTGADVTDQYNPRLPIEDIVVQANCGLASTILTAPPLNDLSQPPNLADLASISGVFDSSNPTCPVMSHTITVGDNDFDLTDDGFDFNPNGPHGFTVTMTQLANTVDYQNGVMPDVVFPVTIQANAKGGATEPTSATVTLAKVCVVELDSTFQLTWTYDLPEFNTDANRQRQFPSASTDYVS